MVFVWGEGGHEAFEKATQQEPPLCQLTQEAEAEGELAPESHTCISAPPHTRLVPAGVLRAQRALHFLACSPDSDLGHRKTNA